LDLPVRTLLLITAFAALISGCSRKPDGLQDFPAVQPMSLTTHTGEAFTEADLQGEVWVVNFFFTRCPTVCPALMLNVNEIAERWADEPRVNFLSISIDGEFDQPEQLTAFAESLQLNTKEWTLATAPRKLVRELAEGSFMQAVGEERDVYGDILHSTRVLVLDRDTALRGWFDASDDKDAPRIDAVLNYLLHE